jgi:hypothetical protein
LILLVYQLLGRLPKHALLMPMVLEVLLVMETFLSNCSEHVITLPDFIESFYLLLLVLLADGLVEVLTVLASLLGPHDLFVLLLPIVDLSLALDNGAPLIRVAFAIAWVVAVALVGEALHRVLLVIHGFLHTHRVHLESIDHAHDNLPILFLFLLTLIPEN